MKLKFVKSPVAFQWSEFNVIGAATWNKKVHHLVLLRCLIVTSIIPKICDKTRSPVSLWL